MVRVKYVNEALCNGNVVVRGFSVGDKSLESMNSVASPRLADLNPTLEIKMC